MVDKIYTPYDHANKVLQIAREFFAEAPGTIADFSCGEGALLEAARRLWGESSKYIANDIDPTPLKKIGWCDYVYNDDFLKFDREVNRRFRSIDLIVLNPPFSYKPSQYRSYIKANKSVRCSPSMCFILNSVDFLSEKGILIGIFPESILWSQKDLDARRYLNLVGYEMVELDHLDHRIFTGYSVSTKIIIVRRHSKKIDSHDLNLSRRSDRVLVGRGSLQVHRSIKLKSEDQNLPTYLHTTNLKRNRIVNSNVYLKSDAVIRPPYVVFPRVGKPNRDKIAIVDQENYVLSDCVMYVRSDKITTERLFGRLSETFDMLYGGSCAKYTTVKHVEELFSDL